MEKIVAEPDFWQDQERAVSLSKELDQLREDVANVEQLKKQAQDIQDLTELAEEKDIQPQLLELERNIAKEERKIFLSGKYDRNDAILTITAGAGGQEAQDWATMLLRMYERYCQKKGWKSQVLNQSFGDPGPEGRIGTKQVSLEIRGQYAFGQLRRENGVHRLVRVSPFSAQNLRHTSFAAIEVIPRIVQEGDQDIIVKPEEIRVDVFRSSGPGGQNVNKRETAVRITHLATGIIVACQTQRTQQENRQKALDMLVGKLYALKEQERQGELTRLKGQKSSIEWGSQIRSYVLHPYQMIKDTRTGVETSNTQGVLDGDLDEFIEAELRVL